MRYSPAGEMTSFVTSNDTAEIVSQQNVYNHNGQRISRTQNETKREYYYDRGVAAFTTDAGSISSANVLDAEGDVIGTYRGSVYHNYLKDGQASTTSIVKEDGTLSAAYEYSDFGETEEITGSSFDNQICYTGGIYDEETGLYYLNARYYDPAIGRFISQDSYRGELDNPGQWHLYAYCANNPINYVDYNGHARARKQTKSYKTSKYFEFVPPTYFKPYIKFTLTIYWKVFNKRIQLLQISELLNVTYSRSPSRGNWKCDKLTKKYDFNQSRSKVTYYAKIHITNKSSVGNSKSIKPKIHLLNSGKALWYTW